MLRQLLPGHPLAPREAGGTMLHPGTDNPEPLPVSGT